MAITHVDAGLVEHTSGDERTEYVLNFPSSVRAGDVLIINMTTNIVGLSSGLTPPDGTVTLAPLSSISGAGVSGAVYWYTVPDPKPSSIVFTWSTARRGTLAWTALSAPGPLALDDQNMGSWSSSSTPSTTAGALNTSVPNTYLVAGLMVGSGSIVPGIPENWTRRTNANEREGTIITRPQVSAGDTGTVTFDTESSGYYQGRAWQIAVREQGGSGGDFVNATLTSEPYPGFSDDVADGASIIFDNQNPQNSVVIGTNKDVGGGLYVFNLSGEIVSSVLDGAANSVDWRDLTGVSGGWNNRLLVFTVDRDDNLLRYYWMDRSNKTLSSAGSTSLAWEPYGSCLYLDNDGSVYVFVTQRGPDDTSPRDMYQYELTVSGSIVSASGPVRTISTSSVVEGLAADDVSGYLFASEEDIGLFRYSASPSGGSARTTVDTVGAGNLIADVEDVAVARNSEDAWLLVSSQGDSSYHVYDLDTLEHQKRFIVYRPNGVDRVTNTDGLDVYLGNFGSEFPNGLMVVHDGDKTPVSDFAFVDTTDIFGELPASGTLKIYLGYDSVPKMGGVSAIYSGEALVWRN